MKYFVVAIPNINNKVSKQTFDVISKGFKTIHFFKKNLLDDSFTIKDKIKHLKLTKEEANFLFEDVMHNKFWSYFILNEEEDIILFVKNYITLREII